MASEKSLAIVLRVVEFSETSCVVTLFSRDFGKIGVLAKGARRPKSPFEAALDLLAVCRIVFLRKSSDGLDLLTEAKLERRFRSASRDLGRLYCGYYLLELLRELTHQGDPHPDLFDLADHSLAAIDHGADLAPIVLWFEFAALRILGHAPRLDDCAECGGALPDLERIAFGQVAGGTLCQRCREGQRQIISVSREALCVLRKFNETSLEHGPPGLPDAVRGESRGLMQHYIAHLLGHRPRMHSYVATAAIRTAIRTGAVQVPGETSARGGGNSRPSSTP
ncbi:MAG: DNA repair protein RecO [Planctomycetes bacterium]|nr:DNA repair protein RecO [Planctomycetota bacterium]